MVVVVGGGGVWVKTMVISSFKIRYSRDCLGGLSKIGGCYIYNIGISLSFDIILDFVKTVIS